MSKKIEQHSFNTVELRADSQGEEFVISGYAALFDSPSKNLGGFVEAVAPEAFTRTLKEKPSVKFTFNHGAAFMARTDNGSLALSTDNKGLKFRAQLNRNIQSHVDLYEAVKAGLYNECSFAFCVTPDGQSWSQDGGQRTLTDVDLLDVSVVGTPAYNGTSASARNQDAASFEALKERVMAMPADWARKEKAEAIGAEIRADAAKAATRAVPRPKPDDESFEAAIADVQNALSKKFSGFWVIETHEDYVIACSYSDEGNKFYRFSYTKDDATGAYTFGDPQEMVSTWVPVAARSIKRIGEFRQRVADAALKQRMRVAAGIGA